jgi:hypothetical protein
MAFGVRPGTIPDPADWVDVTDSIDLTSSSSAILATAGRRTPRAGITPGTLSLTLENADGRYNPRNVSGPYYGDLLNGTPIRVTTGGTGDGLTIDTAVAGPDEPSVVSGPARGSIDVFGAGWVENEDVDEDGTYQERTVVIPVDVADLSTVAVSATFEVIAGGTDSGDDLATGSVFGVFIFDDDPLVFGIPTDELVAFSYLTTGARSVGTTETVTVTFETDAPRWVMLVAPTVKTGDTGIQLGWNVTATIDSYSTRWSGWIDSGWPQTITSRRPTVTITAHDILGLMAQGDAPTSAFDALLRTYTPQPDHWWRPGPTGWIDAVTGVTMRHTGLLEQPSGQTTAIIVGEPAPWGQAEATGYGICEDDNVRLDSGTDAITILARVKFPTVADRTVSGLAEAITLIDQAEEAGFSPLRVTISTESLEVLATNSTGIRQAYTTAPNPPVRLMDGRAHTIMIHVPVGGTILVWLDGRAVELTQDDTAGSYTLAPGDVFVGYAGPAVSSKRPYQGYIDPLIVWRDGFVSTGELAALAVAAHEAATVGLANRRLDQRVAALVAAYGLTAHQGALDTSGIVTQQSYRKDAPLRLLQAIEDTEQGRVWVDRNGELRFSARSWAWDDTVSNTVQVEFSDDPTLLDAAAHEMLEGGTVISDDPLNIVNVASVTSTFGRQQTVEDATSIAVYGRRNTLALSGLLHSSDRQSRSVAEWLLLSQSDPKIQARQVQFRVEDNPTVLAPIAAAIEEGWLVRIVKSTTAETLDMQAHVIGVAHDFRFSGWTVTLTLDATRTGYSFFEWGTSNWGGSAGWSF